MSAKAHLAAVVSLLVLFLFIHARETQAAQSSRVLLLSDIHFDPTADPSLVDQLIEEPPDRWAAVFAQSKLTEVSAYHTDTNWPLFSSAVAYMKVVEPKPSLILVTGDFLPHNLRDKFDGAASPAKRTDANFVKFAHNVVAFVGLHLKQAFPGAAIVSALGNNDSDAKHYALDPDGSFLRGTAGTVSELAGHGGDAKIEKSWASLGSFSTTSRLLPHHRLISLNTVFFSAKYLRENGEADAGPGGQVLDWLEVQLKDAKAAKEKVWLLYHIPPGIDAFATSRNGLPKDAQSCRDSVVTMWRPELEERFDGLMKEYASVVQASFAGHTHKESFLVLGAREEATGFVLVAPSISPSNDGNPAFRTVALGRGGELVDATTYYLDLTKPRWATEYDFDQTWEVKSLNTRDLVAIGKRLADAKGGDRTRWMGEYEIQAEPRKGAGAALSQALYCSVGNLTVENFARCYCPN